MMPYYESLLCKRWGCTPVALGEVPYERILLEIAFMHEEALAKSASGG